MTTLAVGDRVRVAKTSPLFRRGEHLGECGTVLEVGAAWICFRLDSAKSAQVTLRQNAETCLVRVEEER